MRANIGRGLAELGPTMSLDTLVEVLLIGIGTISGWQSHEHTSQILVRVSLPTCCDSFMLDTVCVCVF